MRKTLLVALLLLPAAANAQSFAHGDENWPPPPGPWSNTAALALNITQSAFSDNWSGGDTGSISWQLKGDFGARRQMSQSFHWANQLQLAFGQTANQLADPNDPGSKVWASPVKSTDQILAESVGILTKGWAVDPYGSVRFDSQFIDATDPRRRWLNPMTFTESIGVAKTIAAEGE
ncbi:MAG: DUF3078 domain-containing protein, partial [Gemmatimonadetes bacterium]|nr:DUF3078 domain-containing protein [Gemmatimonadota bacterium]